MTQTSLKDRIFRILTKRMGRMARSENLGKTAEIWLWKTGLGKSLNRFPEQFGNRLVLQFSANGHQLPLSYVEIADELFGIAAETDEIKALQALLSNTAVQVWLPSGWFSGSARILSEIESDALLQSITAENPPRKWRVPQRDGTQHQLKIIAITRTAPCTGTNGPGEYSWIWALSTVFFFFAWLKNILRKKK